MTSIAGMSSAKRDATASWYATSPSFSSCLIRMQCSMTPFCCRSCDDRLDQLARDLDDESGASRLESGVGSAIWKERQPADRAVDQVDDVVEPDGERWMSSRSIGVMKVRSMPRRISCEISSHSCSRRLTCSATAATGRLAREEPVRGSRALSWMRRAMLVEAVEVLLVPGKEVEHAAP